MRKSENPKIMESSIDELYEYKVALKNEFRELLGLPTIESKDEKERIL